MAFITAGPVGGGNSVGGFLAGLGNRVGDVLSAKELAKIEEQANRAEFEIFQKQAAITQANTAQSIAMAGAVGAGLIGLGALVWIGKSVLS